LNAASGGRNWQPGDGWVDERWNRYDWQVSAGCAGDFFCLPEAEEPAGEMAGFEAASTSIAAVPFSLRA
jgi:hypothetical protein